MGRLLALAVLLGVVASAAASAFIEVVALGQQWLFTDLPRALGLGGLPWWWVAILLVVGSGIVLLARPERRPHRYRLPNTPLSWPAPSAEPRWWPAGHGGRNPPRSRS